MKKILLSAPFFLAGIFNSSAQITLTQNDVATIGDTILMARDTTPNTIAVGGTGMQTWDFTSLQIDVLDVNAFIDPSTTFADSSFPNSNIAVDVNNGTSLNFGTVTPDSFNIDGFWGDPFGFGMPVTIVFDPTNKMMEFPSTLNNSFQSHYRLENKFPVNPPQFGIDSAQVIRNSYVIRTMDAFGTLITLADSFDCLRQFSLDTAIDSIYVHANGAWNPMPPEFIAFLPPEWGYTNNPDTSVSYTYSWFANNEGMAVAEVTTDAPSGNVLTASFKITDKVVAGLFSAVNASCNGKCDGSATVTAIGGYAPYTYLWDSAAGNQTTAFADSLCTGTFYVTITDSLGNQSSAFVSISEPTALSDSTNSMDAQCDTCPNGSATAWGYGGTPSYVYNWSSGQSTASIANVLPGTYTVTVTDDNGCKVIDSVVVGFWPVGIKESRNPDFSFQIYPNPTEGSIFLKSGNNELKTILIYNMLGETILREGVSNQIIEIDLRAFENGIYFMKIESQNIIETKRINIVK